MDILITNAVSLDLKTGEERAVTVGIEGGAIAFLEMGERQQAGAGCPRAKGNSLPKASCRLDARGAFLIPNLMDFHTHLFTKGSGFGMNADLLLSAGVTLAVDMGTAGTLGYEAFHQMDVALRTIRIKSFLNLSPLGQPGSGLHEPLGREAIQEERMEELMARYPDEIRGIKVRISREIVGDLGLKPLDHALELGERFGKPVCVHTTNPPERTAAIVKRLRPGDIYSHMYHGKGMCLLEEDGTIPEEFYRAQERGVVLEVGNGRLNFNFPVAERAMAAGIYPDIISSDATARTFGGSPDMKDLPYVMSKFWNMGMPLHKVVAAVTDTPARCLGMGRDAGSLKPGMEANLTLLRTVGRRNVFSDSDGNQREGDRLLVPEMTMLGGRIVFLQGDVELRKG